MRPDAAGSEASPSLPAEQKQLVPSHVRRNTELTLQKLLHECPGWPCPLLQHYTKQLVRHLPLVERLLELEPSLVQEHVDSPRVVDVKVFFEFGAHVPADEVGGDVEAVKVDYLRGLRYINDVHGYM
jgi:hypothetical protein